MNMTNLTEHAHRVASFMLRAKQDIPMVPTMPDEKVRLLRAKLIFEEAMETIDALGVTIALTAEGDEVFTTVTPSGQPQLTAHIDRHACTFKADHEPNLVEIVDGCADIRVVTTGTLLACGVEDVPVLELVDESNLGKFGPGHSYREDGKLIKPADFKAPDFEALLRNMGWKG